MPSPFLYHYLYRNHAYIVENNEFMNKYIASHGDPKFRDDARCTATLTDNRKHLDGVLMVDSLVWLPMGCIGALVAAGVGVGRGMETARWEPQASVSKVIRAGLKKGITKAPVGAISGIVLGKVIIGSVILRWILKDKN